MMPDSILDIFLHPGEFYWGSENTRIRTLLGSCVSITWWHPVHRHGAMCHFMLPDGRGIHHPKYANSAMELVMKEIRQEKSKPDEYIVKVFGGGNMFSKLNKLQGGLIGQSNIDAAFHLLKTNGFVISDSDTGGIRYRKIIFDIWSGDVWLQKQDTAASWVDMDPGDV